MSERPDWIDRMNAAGTPVERPIVTPRPSELVQVDPSAPSMTPEEARERLTEMLDRVRRAYAAHCEVYATDEFDEAEHAADQAALALAIRALELLGEVAACIQPTTIGHVYQYARLTNEQADAVRALAQPEGGA